LARKIFFWPISEEVQPGNSVAFLHEVVFFIDRPAWTVQREDSRGEFQKKRFNEAEEIASQHGG